MDAPEGRALKRIYDLSGIASLFGLCHIFNAALLNNLLDFG